MAATADLEQAVALPVASLTNSQSQVDGRNSSSSSSNRSDSSSDDDEDVPVEEPAGYPRYASLLGRHAEYQNFRRFRRLRMRMLLLKQDEILKLEKELDKQDRTESHELYLSSCRSDQNATRKKLLGELDEAFKNYDAFLQASHWAFNATGPVKRDVASQKHQLEGAGLIAETQYLLAPHQSDRELLNIGLVKDRGLVRVAGIVEVVVGALKRCFSRPKGGKTLNISNKFVRGVTRFVVATIAIILLLGPIIALNAVKKAVVRFVIIFASATLFVGIITAASQASLGEIFGAGAAYAAVLVVFVSGSGVSDSSSTVSAANATATATATGI